MNKQVRFWLLTVATLLALGLTLSLGRWQLSRAAQKELLQAQIEASEKLPALDGAQLLASPEPLSLLHRPVHLQGQWLADKTVYLDNRPMQAKVGFYVFTPLKIAGTQQAVLVQRGWLPRNFNQRNQLPPLATRSGVIEVTGLLAPAPAKLLELGSGEQGAIRQNLDLAAYSEEIGQALLPLTLVQTGAASEGLLRDWPQSSAGIDKHYGYAIQWFALAALISILYVWFQIVRKFFKPKNS